MDHTALVSSYLDLAKPLDQLPYSAEFDQLVTAYQSASGEVSPQREIWRELLNLRKKGKLPRLRR